MNKKKIGNFLKKVRIENNISEEQFAKDINLTIEQVKKLEKGKISLTVEMLNNIEKTLKITPFEVINGAYGTSKEDRENAVLLLLDNYLKIKNKGKKTGIIIFIITIPLILISLVLFPYLYINRDLGYELYGKSENFIYSDSLFLHDNGLYFFSFGNLEIKNPKIIEDTITNAKLMCNERLIISSSRLLKESLREQKGYDEYFPKEVVDNIDDWYYEITYNIDGIEKTERIELENKKFDK